MVVESIPAMREAPSEGVSAVVKSPPMFTVVPSERMIVSGKIAPVRIALNGLCES